MGLFLQLVLHLFFCISLSFVTEDSLLNSSDPNTERFLKSTERQCADFNIGASRGALAGLQDIYTCPADGISRLMCFEEFPLRSVGEITSSSVGWEHVVFYLLVGPNSKTDAFYWWLPFVKVPFDIVIVGDSCSNNQETCDDHPSRIRAEAANKFPLIRFHIVRVNPPDNEYKYLSCKLRTGARKIYELFPDKKYYFKIDTDTIVFPKRFHNFIRTLDSVVSSNSSHPIYFGAIVESGMNLMLCGRMTWERGNLTKGGLCYAQGGAGYGLNNIAMKTIASTPPCTMENREEYPEDSFVAIRLWDVFQISVIHCGGFSSSEIYTDFKAKTSITFHYIDANWLRGYGSALMKHAHSERSES